MTDKVKNVCDDLISVVVPVYNISPYLERCVHSIQKQTYSNLEIILVDNGSTDGSTKLVDDLATEDYRIVPIHETSQGVTHARLTGVSCANGEWIGFVDGDDVIESDMFERLLKNAKQYQTQISHCGYQMVFDDGRVHYFYNTGRLAQQDKLTGLKDLLDGSFIEPGLWNKLFHKTLFHSLLHDGSMDYSIKNNEDLLMNFILFSNAEKSVYEDLCPYHYIVRKQSASRGRLNQNRILDPIKVKGIIVNLAPDELKDRAKSAYICTCINTYNGLLSDCYQEERKRVFELLVDRKDWVRYTSKKTKLMAFGIQHMQYIYKKVYKLYSRYFQSKKYE